MGEGVKRITYLAGKQILNDCESYSCLQFRLFRNPLGAQRCKHFRDRFAVQTFARDEDRVTL